MSAHTKEKEKALFSLCLGFHVSLLETKSVQARLTRHRKQFVLADCTSITVQQNLGISLLSRFLCLQKADCFAKEKLRAAPRFNL